MAEKKARKRPEKKSPRARARGCLARLVALALSTFVTLLVAELAVRLIAPQVLYPRYVTASDFGIRVNVPNARYWHTSPEMRAEFRINSMGIRSDREYTYDKPEKTIRVVGLGDSFTQGYEVSVEESYLHLLEKGLRDKGWPAEVINLGVSGHSSAEELIMLENRGFRFEPDVVVVGYYQNDLDDNVRSGLYRLDEAGVLERAADSYLPAVGLRDRLYSFGLYRWLASHSHLLCLFREQVALWVKRQEVERNMREAAQGSEDADEEGAREAALAARDKLGARILDEIKRQSAKRDVHFLILDIPDHDLSESSLPVKHFQVITSDDIVEARPALQKSGRRESLYRQRGHFHWTPQGHEVGARLLTERIHGMLSETHRPDGTRRTE